MTTQQICDRLAEEEGWKRSVMVDEETGETYCMWEKDGSEHPHPFHCDSLNAAVRAVPAGYGWAIGTEACGRFKAWLIEYATLREISIVRSNPVDAMFAVNAMARGWA
jgi:hypothetical protein